MGTLTPAIRAITSALPLLVTGVRTDHEHAAATPDDPASLAHRFHGRSYLHRLSLATYPIDRKKAPQPHESGRQAPKKTALGPRRKDSSGFVPAACVVRGPGRGWVGEAGCAPRVARYAPSFGHERRSHAGAT